MDGAPPMIDIAAAITCLAMMTGLPEAAPPEVRVVPAAEWPRMHASARALYSPLHGGLIRLRPGGEHLVVHELVHHLQSRAGMSTYTDAAQGQAWHMQWRFRFECPEAQRAP